MVKNPKSYILGTHKYYSSTISVIFLGIFINALSYKLGSNGFWL